MKEEYTWEYFKEDTPIFLPVKRGIRNTQKHCIPYEHTAHLLGTTDPYTEGGDK